MFSITDKKKSLPFLFGIVLLFVGLTLSKALTSLVTIYMIFLFLLQKEKKTLWISLQNNKSIRWFLILIGWMLFSILWSTDKYTGFKVISSDLNFFLWPLIMVLFVDKLIQFKQLILQIFIFTVLSVSIIQFIYFQGKNGYPDIRDMALFVSHIRFALMIDIALFLSGYFFIISPKKLPKLGWMISVLWFLFYTYYSQVLSGLLGIFGGVVGLIIYFVLKHTSKKVKIGAFFSLVVLSLGVFYIAKDFSNLDVVKIPENLPTHTILGNQYEHKVHTNIIENGYFLDLYYCEKEVDSIWRLRSKLKLDDVGPRGYQYKYVVKRYLTSKGLRKDADGMNKLSNKDIENMKQGVSSVVELESGLWARYKQLKHELSGNLDPNGHSVLQRFEFWKTSSHIIKNHWLLGVGIGGSKEAFSKAYKETHTKLTLENQWESHNQFLTYWVNFGIIGLLLFLMWLFSVFKNIIQSEGIFFCILSVLVSSFFVEDTLGTLTGMTLFAFFAGFFQNRLPLKQG